MLMTSAEDVTVSDPDSVTPAWVAAKTTEPDLHAPVEIWKFAFVSPGATVMFDGTVATAGSLLESATAFPPGGAGALKVTVPVAAAPPATLAGTTRTDDRAAAAGFTASVADLVIPLSDAVIVTEVATVTALVPIVNVALVAP